MIENEKRYYTLMHHVRRMLRSGLISEEEYRDIDTRYAQKYQPKFGVLLVEKDLISERRRGIYGVGKEVSDNENQCC